MLTGIDDDFESKIVATLEDIWNQMQMNERAKVMQQKRNQLQQQREQMLKAGGANPRSSKTVNLQPEQTQQKRRKRFQPDEATTSPTQQAAAMPQAAAEPRPTALNPVPTVGSAVSAVAKMFGNIDIDIAAARNLNSHPPAQPRGRKRKCSGRAK